MLPRHCSSILQKAHMSLAAPSSELAAVLSHWSGGDVLLKRSGAVARLVLDRPEKNNCLSGHMMSQLRRRVEELSSSENDFSVVVVEGSGRSFCSGADLGLINEISTAPMGSAMFNYMADTLTALRRSRPLVVARIHGYCLGGATEIATSCDMRIAHKDSKIGFMQAMMGIIPSWGGASWLEETVGRSTALRLMATAPMLTAAEAKKFGWIDEVYESEEEAENFIASLSKFSPAVVQAQKSMLAAVKEKDRSAEDKVIQSVWGGVDQKKAIEKQLTSLKK